jgi:hypothetical protein
VHHQDTAVSDDYGGGPFSFIHEPQANRWPAIVLNVVDNIGTPLTDLDG